MQNEVARQRDEITRLKARQYPQRILGGGGGGRNIVAVCVGCDYDSVTHSSMVTAVRLQSIPSGYDPDAEERFLAWGGVDPIIRTHMIVILKPIVPIPADPSIKWFAQASLTADPTQLAPPAQECVVRFGDPCSGDVDIDLCNP